MIEKKEIIDYFREYKRIHVRGIERKIKVPTDSDFFVSIIGPQRAEKTHYLLFLRDGVKDAAYPNFKDARLYKATYRDIFEDLHRNLQQRAFDGFLLLQW